MDVNAVAGELGEALKAVPGLHVPEWGSERVHPPFAIIPLPERIDYDGTYQRGKDNYPDVAVLILLANPKQPATRREIAKYAAGSGEHSVKAAIEAGTYTALDTVRVAWAEFSEVRYYAVDYLAAIFHLDITGKGATT